MGSCYVIDSYLVSSIGDISESYLVRAGEYFNNTNYEPRYNLRHITIARQTID